MLAKTKAECEKKLKSLIAAQKESEPQPPREKMSYIDEIIEAYYKKYNEANNILTATLSYVVEPNDNQLSQIKNYLAKKYNKETVEITMIEQPELIGGFVLKVGDIEEDNSIRGRLNRLEKKLTWR